VPHEELLGKTLLLIVEKLPNPRLIQTIET